MDGEGLLESKLPGVPFETSILQSVCHTRKSAWKRYKHFFPGVSKAASDNTLNLSVFFKQIQRKKDAISNNTSMHF